MSKALDVASSIELHVEAPSLEIFPLGQEVQADAPADEYVFILQSLHDDEEVPADPQYLPAAQLVQLDDPALAYFPAVHEVQPDAPEAEYLPALHVLQLVACAAEYFPAVHDEQAEAPEDAYCPALHEVQPDACAVEYDPAEHASHHAAAAVEY
eukprot:SAG31_NODE_1410_length_8470_cov_6.064031_8_plen_154_part_00